MKNLFISLALMFSFAAHAADLTPAQKITFKAAIIAETDTTLAACRAARNDMCIAEWYNADKSPAVLVWREAVTAQDLFESMNIVQYDSVSIGKRASWELMLRYAPLDFSRAAYRKTLADIWDSAQAGVNAATFASLATACCTKNASRFEAVFNLTSKTQNANTGGGSVTARNRQVLGPVTVSNVSDVLNN